MKKIILAIFEELFPIVDLFPKASFYAVIWKPFGSRNSLMHLSDKFATYLWLMAMQRFEKTVWIYDLL